MKKILIFHHYNTAVGAGLCLLHIVNAICDIYKVTVVLPEGGNLSDKLKKIGVDVVNIGNFPHGYSHYNGASVAFFSLTHIKNIIDIKRDKRIVRDIIQKVAPDIVAVNSMTLFWIGAVAKKFNIKSVCFHRETYRRGFLGVRTAFIKHKLKKDFNAVVYISAYDMKETGKSLNKACVITDKVDADLFIGDKKLLRQKMNLPIDKKLLLYVGGVSKLKGILIALKAFSMIKRDNVGLVILQYKKNIRSNNIVNKLKRIVRKNYFEEVEKIICNQDSIYLFPATDVVNEYFMACDAVLFPSTKAHQARPIYEAGMARRPIFISNFVNTREFVDETKGYCFKPGNYKDLARKLIEWIDNPEKAQDRLQNNYTQSIKNHNLCSLSFELKELFESI